MTIFSGARNDDDPGLPPLRPERLAAGGAIDLQIKRRSYQPERIMRRLNWAFWVLFAALAVGLGAVAMAVLP